MTVSTCQKITFISCIVLCMSLFLPKMFLSRGKKDIVQSDVGPGHFPPFRRGHSFSEDQDHWDTESHYTKHYNPEAIAITKGAGRPNLLGQVIPVYGFGIFLYIIYLFFKLTSKDKPHRNGCRFPIMPPEYTLQEMSPCQLVQLQTRMSEKVKEKRISKVVHVSARSRRGTRKREERKLKQLKEITQMMRERQLREGATPEEEAEEAPYTADWEGYPEETYPVFDMSCRRCRYPSVILEEPDQVIPTAEELAERMEKEEEEEGVVENEPADDDVHQKEEANCENEEEKQEENKDDNEQEEEEEEDEEEEGDEEENEEEEDDEEEDIGEDHPCLPQSTDEGEKRLKYPSEKEEKQKTTRKRQITFSDHRLVFHYPKGGAVGCKYEEEEEEEVEKEEEEEDIEEEEEEEEDGEEGNEDEEEEKEDDDDYEEDDKQHDEGLSETEEKEEEDPLMEAESLGFNDDAECDPDEQEVDLIDFLQTYQPEVTVISNQSQTPKAQGSGTLRMRHKKQKVKK